MEEELIDRIQKVEKELKSTKYLVVFLILMFVVLAYQYITVQQKNQLSVDLVKTRGLIIQDKYGKDIMLMGAPIPSTKARRRTDPLKGFLMLDGNGKDRLFMGQEGSIQVNGNLFNRIDKGWGFLVNGKNGNERGGFGILDSLNSMVLSMNYPSGEAIMMVAEPMNAFVQIKSDSGEYQRERILLSHQRNEYERTFIKLGDNSADERILIQAIEDREPSLEYLKRDGIKKDLLK